MAKSKQTKQYYKRRARKVTNIKITKKRKKQ